METKRRARRKGRRSEVLAVRVSPETRYRAELLGLLHQRSVSEVIEIALERLASAPESRGGAVLVNQVETWSETIKMGDDETIDLIEETWDEEEWARRLKLAALHPKCLPPEERVFWLGILGDPDNFVGSDVPDDIEIEDDEPTPVEELLFGRPALKLRPMKRDLIRHKWERFISSSMKT